MRRFASITAFCLSLALPAALYAQDAERGLIQGTLEDALSGPGRTVKLDGFEGALSSIATIETMTVEDETGIWLTLRDVELDWSRAALLRGRLEVNKLSAAEIDLPRLPVPVEQDVSPEATPFSVPELPVSVNVSEISSPSISLGAPVLGQAAELSLDGSLRLEGGEGEASLLAGRTDGPLGEFEIEAAFRNEDSHLALTIRLQEDSGGIAVTLLGLPGAPSLGLDVAGAGPLSDYQAEIALATDGTPRLTGAVSLQQLGPETAGDQGFSAQLRGDVTPLFEAQYAEFFGPQSTLNIAGTRTAEGRTLLDQFALQTKAITLDGTVALSPGGLPESIEVTGRIAQDDGTPVLLPLPGAETRISTADLAVSFDAARGELWTGGFVINDLTRPELKADVLRLNGEGRIGRRAEDGVAFVTAGFDFAAEALDLGSQAAEEALGERVSGTARLDWASDAPLDIQSLRVEGESYEASLSGSLSLRDDLRFSGEVAANIDALRAFSGLAGRALSGAADVSLRGDVAFLSGQFDIAAQAATVDLTVGEKRLDPLLAGATQLTILASRTENGLDVQTLRAATPFALIDARGAWREDGSFGTLEARLDDSALLLDELRGALTLTATAQQAGALWALDVAADGETLSSAISGILDMAGTVPVFDGDVSADLADVAPLSELIGRQLSGGAAVDASGAMALDASSVNASVAINTLNLTTGVPDADILLRGAAQMSADLRRAGARSELSDLRFTSRALELAGSALLAPDADRVSVSGVLADLGPFVADLPGPVRFQAAAENTGDGAWDADVSATGPAGSQLQLSGQVSQDFTRADLRMSGQGPLAIANWAIAPRQLGGTATFDLGLNGPLVLGSLSGQVRASNARLVAPELRIVLEDITASATLARAVAELDISARVQDGGRITMTGPIGLTDPFNGDLDLGLNRVVLRDPLLYETTASGTVSIAGAMANAPAVSGRITLDGAEVRVPNAPIAGSNSVPEITHVGEPGAVRVTRTRAGLIATGDATGGSTRALPLNVLVAAPNRVFIRGRGLDAELGGQLRLGGTTADIAPAGQFDLVRGRLDILGQRLVLTEGLVRLQGGLDPFIRLVATTETPEATVRIVVEGRASDPQISFLSEPDLPQDEVVAQLLFGRGIENLTPLQAAQLASAVATLAGRGGDGILTRLRERSGLDDLDITSDEEGTTAVRAGKYISDRVYSDVVVGSDGDSEINLNFDLTPRVTVRGSADTDGNTGVGLFFQRDY